MEINTNPNHSPPKEEPLDKPKCTHRSTTVEMMNENQATHTNETINVTERNGNSNNT